MSFTIDKVVTSGTFSLDGGTWEVDNNVWILGDEREALVIDAAHDGAAIVSAIGDRELKYILCTHGHDDHISAVTDVLAQHPEAKVLINPADRMLWDREIDREPDGELVDGQTIDIAGQTLQVIHTPGHSPGAVCLYLQDDDTQHILFSGDTLFQGGPGATGRSFSDFDTIVDSIRTKLLTLPADTVVHTGHGDDTSIGAEAAHQDEWSQD